MWTVRKTLGLSVLSGQVCNGPVVSLYLNMIMFTTSPCLDFLCASDAYLYINVAKRIVQKQLRLTEGEQRITSVTQ